MMLASPLQDQTNLLAADWAQDRLNSWKEIAVFFRREVRTVQMWEKKEGLPVRRQQHGKLGSVFALRQELEQWWISRSSVNPLYSPAQPAQSTLTREPATLSATEATVSRRVLSMPFELVVSSNESSALRRSIACFGEGLRAELNVELGRLKLHPIALPAKALPSPGSTSLSFLRTITREFDVGFLLCGTITHVNDRIRIIVQLVLGADSCCAWSERFEYDLRSLQAQAPVAAHIAQAAAAHILRDNPSMLERPASDSRLAVNAYGMGLHFWNQRSRKTLVKAITYLQDAVELDPECAGAYATLADAYVSLSYHHLMSPQQAGLKAAEVIASALRLEPDSIQVRNAYINVLLNCQLKVADAARECARLVAEGHANSRTFELYSIALGAAGSHREAVGRALQAHRSAPDSHSGVSQMGQAHFYAQNQREAREYARLAVQMKPQSVMNYAMLGRIEAMLSNWDGVQEAAAKIAALSSDSMLSQTLLAYAYAGTEDHRRASELLDALQQRRQDACYPAYEIAVAQLMLRREDEALDSLARASDVGDMKTIFIAQDPALARLRCRPGFHRVASASRVA